jgi:hypothetical protein
MEALPIFIKYTMVTQKNEIISTFRLYFSHPQQWIKLDT